jgi:hypothetical protein
MRKNPDLGSGMNIPDHFSESLETFFYGKILKFFDADPDPGSGMQDFFDPGSASKNLSNFEYNLFIIHCEVILEIVFVFF